MHATYYYVMCATLYEIANGDDDGVESTRRPLLSHRPKANLHTMKFSILSVAAVLSTASAFGVPVSLAVVPRC